MLSQPRLRSRLGFCPIDWPEQVWATLSGYFFRSFVAPLGYFAVVAGQEDVGDI